MEPDMRAILRHRAAGIFLVLGVMAWGSCSAPTEPPPPPKSIYPLSVGNRWTYEYRYAGLSPVSWVYEVTRTYPAGFYGGTVMAYTMTNYRKGSPPSPIEWLRWSGPDGIYDLGGVSPSDTFFTEIQHLKYPAAVGESLEVPSLVYSEGGFFITDTLTHIVVANREKLWTPAGVFTCFVVEYRRRIADDVHERWVYRHYYSPGVGWVGYIARGEILGFVHEQLLLSEYLLF
jgi:hypothetical protein